MRKRLLLSPAVGKVFRHFNNFSTHAEPISFTHTVLNRSFFIVSRLSKSLFSGIFKSWSDHHNTLYFYVHILYQIVGFIHYKDGINKRRWIKRSFIVEIVLDLASALKSHSPTKNTLNSCLCAATNFIIGHLVLSQPVFHKSTKTLSQQILLKHYQSKIVKKKN